MKSKAGVSRIFPMGNDFWYHEQFIVKLTERLKIDKISYRYGSNDSGISVLKSRKNY